MNNSLSEIQTYLQELCKSHVMLKHIPEEHDSFARLNTEDEVLKLSGSSAENIVVVLGVTARRDGEVDERKISRGVEILFGSKATTDGDRGEAVTMAMDQSENILMDFLDKMQEDMEDYCAVSLDYEKANWDAHDGPFLDNFFGWTLFVPFISYFKKRNPNVWK